MYYTKKDLERMRKEGKSFKKNKRSKKENNEKVINMHR